MGAFEFPDAFREAHEVVYVVVAVLKTAFAESVDREVLGAARRMVCNPLFVELHGEECSGVAADFGKGGIPTRIAIAILYIRCKCFIA